VEKPLVLKCLLHVAKGRKGIDRRGKKGWSAGQGTRRHGSFRRRGVGHSGGPQLQMSGHRPLGQMVAWMWGINGAGVRRIGLGWKYLYD